MREHQASVRDLRTDFRAVKRKVEELGEVVITDHGEPAYVLKLLPPALRPPRKALPDYMRRLLAQRPEPMSPEAAQAIHELNRADR